MRFVAISDTHDQLKGIDIPDGDVLIHCGDATGIGSVSSVNQFCKDYSQLPHKYKFFTPGNHDWLFYRELPLAKQICKDFGINVLIDAVDDSIGFSIYMSPWTPNFGTWAFMKDEEQLQLIWNDIPNDLDILVTHGPPLNILDWNFLGDHCGSKALHKVVFEKKPKIHIFGHIHEAHGEIVQDNIKFINAALLNDEYKPAFRPIVFDLTK